LASRSVTTSERPSGVTETCAAPSPPGASARVPPGIAFSEPSKRRQNAATPGVPPELRT